MLPINKILYILDLETAKFMFKCNNHQLPLTFKNFFQMFKTVQSGCIRFSIKLNQIYAPK